MPASSFSIEKVGEIAIVIPSPQAEKMPEDLMLQATHLILEPLDRMKPTGLIFDLSGVDYVGSLFLGFLLRCHKRVKGHGCEVVISGPSQSARELLHITALDTLWPIYATRAEALNALGGD
ncbi:MAG: anti-sigma factor antagonist [Gemmataceae bacterium]|nr:anti-sigma factor antagonist [Gemmataceae bacterium]